MNKLYLSNYDIERHVQNILREMQKDGYRPDYVIGLTRGGLTPANLISQYLDVPMQTLKVSLRDNPDTETNCWMAEDAFGYENKETDVIDGEAVTMFGMGKEILIVDDINDTGATLNWIINDWQRSCLPNSEHWNSVWGNNVRFAVIVDNLSSEFQRKVDYCGMEINKAEEDVWIVFPWEEWWLR